MTSEEIIAHQAEEKRFRETPIGAAFSRFMAEHDFAIDVDHRGTATDRRLREVWDRERAARDEFLALVKQQSIQVESTSWQPIETAPKDGTRILVGWVGNPAVNRLHFRKGEWRDDDADAVYMTPTHWMPLPAPPSINTPSTD